jgi:hypothetical protein
MSESDQRRDAASCAALRRIGSRKFPPEARSIASRPEGVVDVAALGLESYFRRMWGRDERGREGEGTHIGQDLA